MGSNLVLVGYSAAPIARLVNPSICGALARRCQLEWAVVAGAVPGARASSCRSRWRRHQTRLALGNAGGACGRVYGRGSGKRLRVPPDAYVVGVQWAEGEPAWSCNVASGSGRYRMCAPSLRGWKNILRGPSWYWIGQAVR